jgi:VanZ family protein
MLSRRGRIAKTMPQLTKQTSSWSRNRQFWQWLLAGYWLMLFAATHMPKNLPGVPSGHGDKLAHFSAYAVLAGLIATTWQLSAGVLTFAHLRWAWIVIAAYGAIDEWTQLAVGRDASLLDWLADCAGACAGLAVFSWIASRKVRQ